MSPLLLTILGRVKPPGPWLNGAAKSEAIQ
jgi:hypothetical protein